VAVPLACLCALMLTPLLRHLAPRWRDAEVSG
jgi:hypothetical protein